MTEDLPGMGSEDQRGQMGPARVSPAVLYMVSDLSKDKTGKFLYAGGKRVAEIKVVMSDGLRKEEGVISAQEIAAAEDQIFLPDEPVSFM